MNIKPGEPVPPGYEDEVAPIAEIQYAIDQYKGNALLGLEYALEIQDPNRHEPSYYCVLCDKRGDPRTVMQHWTSFNHRNKYLEKHFSTAMREANPIRYKPNGNHIMVLLVQKLSEAIEDHHGRMQPRVCDVNEFHHMKSKMIAGVNARPHFNDHMVGGLNLCPLVNQIVKANMGTKSSVVKEAASPNQTLQITLKAPMKRSAENSIHSSRGVEAPDAPSMERDNFDEISSDSDGRSPLNAADAPKKAKKREQSPAYRVVPRVHRSPPFDDIDSPASSASLTAAAATFKKKLPTPKELSLQASHIAQERYKWEKYRCMLELELVEMDKIQQGHDKNPERHPLYPDEWKKFWNRRYKELQAEKKVDPNKHDYKPEWIAFWTKRMQELYTAEVEKKKREIKIKFGLPEDAEETVDSLKEKYKVQVPNKIAASSSLSSASASLPVVSPTPQGTTTPISKPIETTKQPRKSEREKVSTDVIDISDDDDDISLDSPPQHHHHHHQQQRHHRHPARSRSGSLSRTRLSRSRSPRSMRLYSSRPVRSGSRSKSPILDYDHYHSSGSGGGGVVSHHGHPPMPPYSKDYYINSSRSGGYPRGRYYGKPGSGIPPSMGSGLSYRVMDSREYPRYEDLSPSPSPQTTSSKSITNDEKKTEPEDDDEGQITVVSVLRLLTALEDHLGSLGPKVVDLLGKALAMEKVKANAADDLLLIEDYCVFFETMKEKLKGLLIAEMIEDPHKIRAVKKAIKNIATVVHQVTTKQTGLETSDTSGKKKTTASVTKATTDEKRSSGIIDLPFDRNLIATKLAAALVREGREDVSTADMNKLIYVFLLMVKMSRARREIDGEYVYVRHLLPFVDIAEPTASVQNVDPSMTMMARAMRMVSMPSLCDELAEVEALILAAEEGNPNENNMSSSSNNSNNINNSNNNKINNNSNNNSSNNNNNNSNNNNTSTKISNNNDTNNKNNNDNNNMNAGNGIGDALSAADNDTGSGSTLESLTDSDLQTLLQNFNHLSTEEQTHLIAHLKKLETFDPKRVENLRKFVNVSDDVPSSSSTNNNNSAPASANFQSRAGEPSMMNTFGNGGGSNSSRTTKMTPSPHSSRHESQKSSGISDSRATTLTNNINSNSPHYSDDEDGRNFNNPNTDRQHRQHQATTEVILNANQDNVRNRNINDHDDDDDDDDDDDYNFQEALEAANSIRFNDSAQNAKTIMRNATPTNSNNGGGGGSSIGTIGGSESVSLTNSVPFSSSPNALTFNPAGLKSSINDTHNLIANIMGSLQQSNSNKNTMGNGNNLKDNLSSASSTSGFNSNSTAMERNPSQRPQRAAMGYSSVSMGSGFGQQQQQQQQQHQQQQQQQQQQIQQQHHNYPNQQQMMGVPYGNDNSADAYNQMNGDPNAYYYGGYNNMNANNGFSMGGGGGYSQHWGMQHEQQQQQQQQQMQYGMQDFMNPQHQQQQMGYNMYGGGGGGGGGVIGGKRGGRGGN